jgi:hypothetical protein
VNLTEELPALITKIFISILPGVGPYGDGGSKLPETGAQRMKSNATIEEIDTPAAVLSTPHPRFSQPSSNIPKQGKYALTTTFPKLSSPYLDGD